MEWNDLYEKIGGSRLDTAAGTVWEPMPPLVLSAWNFSKDDDRQKRFHEHLAWAHQRGTLHIVVVIVERPQLPLLNRERHPCRERAGGCHYEGG